MEFLRPFTFLLILAESAALLPKNPTLLLFSTVSSLLLHTALCISFTHTLHHFLRTKFQTSIPDLNPLLNLPDLGSISPAAPDLGFDVPNFTSPFLHSRQDLAVILAVQLAFLLAFFIISSFSTISTTVISAVCYKSRTLSFKAFLSTISRTCPRFLVTCFYVSTLTLGYFTIVVTVLSPLLIYVNFSKIWTTITAIIALLFFLYLFVVFALSLVVSVIEENCYGIEALGKAAALIKGGRVHGFFLNICFNGVVLVVFLICNYTTPHSHGKGLVISLTVSQIVMMNAGFLMKIFMDIAYTVLYFHCKKDHGEEIELYGSLQYSRLPTMFSLTDDDEDLP